MNGEPASSTLSPDHPGSATSTELIWQLYQDVRDRLRRRPAYTYLLDQSLLELELRRAWGEDCGAQDPVLSFQAGLANLPNEPSAGPWLYRGAAQAGWLAIQLGRHTGHTPPLTGVDLAVSTWLADFPTTSDVDLPRGVLGLAVYALNHPDQRTRTRLLEGVWRVLRSRVEREADGAFIRLAPDPARVSDGSAGCRIIGAAHGTAGLASFLSSLLEHARSSGSSQWQADVDGMLQDATDWLLNQYREPPTEEGAPWRGVFPHRIEQPEPTTRLTWCSGDLGISLCLRVVHRATGREETARIADLIDSRVVRRSELELATGDPGDWGMADACLCHGAAGLIWYASRVTGQHGSRAHALGLRWEEWVRTRRVSGPLRYFGPSGMVGDPSFLEGDVGVALALLNRTSDTPPLWEDLLLARTVEASE